MECVELALDETAAAKARTDAINELKTANECDELEAFARTDDLGEQYRRRALESLATRHCDSTLHDLVDAEHLAKPCHQEAVELLTTGEDD